MKLLKQFIQIILIIFTFIGLILINALYTTNRFIPELIFGYIGLALPEMYAIILIIDNYIESKKRQEE